MREKMNKLYTQPAVLFWMSFLSLVLAIVSLFWGRMKDPLILIMFVISYVGSFILFIDKTRKNNHIERISKSCIKDLQSIYEVTYSLTSKMKEAQSIIYINYQKFADRLKTNSGESKDRIFIEFYKEIKRSMNMVFEKVTNDLKRELEELYEVKYGKKVKIGVCIKQLSKCFVKGKPIDDLKVLCIYRDKDSYDAKREIGKPYYVKKNTVFNQCLNLNNSHDGAYVENNITKAIEENRYSCENEGEILQHKFYNKTAAVPIIHIEQSDKLCYGFLCVDALEDEKLELFESKEISRILQVYANMLAIYYYEVQAYFPIIFGHIYDIYKEKITDDTD